MPFSGADYAGGAFGAQGDAAVALVKEGVHFLADNIGGLTHTAGKYLSVFKGGQTDLPVAVQAYRAAQLFLQMQPAAAGFGEDILRALGFCIFYSHNNRSSLV